MLSNAGVGQAAHSCVACFARAVTSTFFLDPHSPVPAYAQLKDQIKLALASQRLNPGDALPSIRQLAHRLHVGNGVVRRAYRDLRNVGLLATERRKHVVVPALVSSDASAK